MYFSLVQFKMLCSFCQIFGHHTRKILIWIYCSLEMITVHLTLLVPEINWESPLVEITIMLNLLHEVFSVRDKYRIVCQSSGGEESL